MKLNLTRRRAILLPFVWATSSLLSSCVLLPAASVAMRAAEIRVITSGAFTEAYQMRVPDFDSASGHKVNASFGASMGNAPDAAGSRRAA